MYLALVHCIDADGTSLREQLVKQGKIALSMDGVQFDETSPALYVLRDTISGRVLYSERVPKKDAEHLRPLLRKVKEIGVPIIGVVSDKEAAQVLAVELELPGVPHQYCQTHFLKNVGKPMESDLATIAATVQEAATSIRAVERELTDEAKNQTLTKSAKAELELALKLCQSARTGSKASGDAILYPAQLKRIERLQKVAQVAGEAVDTKTKGEKSQKKREKISPYLMSVLGALAAVTAQAALTKRVSSQVEMVRKVAHILNFRCDSSQVKRLLSTYLNQLLDRAKKLSPTSAMGEFIRQLDAVADRYWCGLFHCYDIPQLPRNNNALEQLFGRFKRSERRVTGRKSTAGGPLETCAEFLLDAWDASSVTPNLKALLSEVSDEQLQAALDKMAELSEPARVKRSLQRDPDRFLAEALEAWKES